MRMTLHNSDVVSVERFRWIDKCGHPHQVGNMTTTHLFFSLRMLWNHNVPKDWKIHPYIRYDLSRKPKAYVHEAVYCLMHELNKRDDLTPYFKRCLREMFERIEEHNGTVLLETGG